MAPCLPGRPPTPLELHARTLASADDAAGRRENFCFAGIQSHAWKHPKKCENFASQALAMLYPMYAVRAEVLLEMTRIDAHEKLKAGNNILREVNE